MDASSEDGPAAGDRPAPDEERPRSRPRRASRPGAAPRRRPSPAGRPRSAAPASRRRPPARRDAARRQPSQRTTVVVLSVLSAVVVAVAIGAFMVGSGAPSTRGAGQPTTVPSGPSTSVAPSTVPPAALTTFRDPTSGFSIQYPRAWERVELEDPEGSNIRLMVLAGELDVFQVRAQRFEQPTTAENIENVKAVTQALITSNKTAKILQERQITIDGMPGYYYLYTYADPSGQEGVHAHYFLYRGRKAFQLVFQAVPTSDFQPLAFVYDQVAESLRTDPDT